MASLETPAAFTISVARIGDAHVVTLTGEVDLYYAGELRAALDALAEADRAAVIVDLCDVTFVDSTALGILVGTAKRVAAHGGHLTLVSTDPRFKKLIQITGLLDVLHLEPTLARAVETVVAAPA